MTAVDERTAWTLTDRRTRRRHDGEKYDGSSLVGRPGQDAAAGRGRARRAGRARRRARARDLPGPGRRALADLLPPAPGPRGRDPLSARPLPRPRQAPDRGGEEGGSLRRSDRRHDAEAGRLLDTDRESPPRGARKAEGRFGAGDPRARA